MSILRLPQIGLQNPRSLRFADNSGNKVTFGNKASLNQMVKGTILFWLVPDDTNNTFRNIISKYHNSNYSGWIIYKPGADGSTIRFDWNGGLYQSIYPNTGLVVVDEPNFIAFVFDRNASSTSDLHMYKGSLYSPAQEVTYDTREIGSSLSDDSANSLTVGTTYLDTDMCIDADIPWLGIWSGAKLTIEEIRQQQKYLFPVVRKSNCVLSVRLGLSGTSTQYDESGRGNNGTVTGATVAGGIPLVYPKPKIYWVLSAPAGILRGSDILYPDGVVSAGVWKDQSGGSNLYAAIDEITPLDTDYAWDENAVVGDYFEVSLSNPGYSPGPGLHTLRWRAAKISGARTTSVKCELRQGASTVIASDTRQLTGSYQTFTYNLTSGEAANITDYTDLRLRFTITAIT